MEEFQKARNTRRLLQLIPTTGLWKPVSETIKDQNGVTMLTKKRLSCWAEYFEQHLSWSQGATHLEHAVDAEPWTVNAESATASEAGDCVDTVCREEINLHITRFQGML
ncbi:hypothetical protein CLF_113292 [Clonorchis sinensis]|uniref:Uncharacterized protein n=1 Tax=Clonorchis sinensis TaxID=79923 RepID=G7YMU2_CLOSI|nr:hypothetical protein CLF_113292 [Clonorchis sinensis]